MISWLNPLLGGALIGLAVSLTLFFNGRVAGISGIIYGLLHPLKGDITWRLYFILGMLSGGLILQLTNPSVFDGALAIPEWTVAAAGLLVGFGTVLGSGCTSGHGVCGISRLSLRSIVATVIFVAFGILTVLVIKKIGLLA